MTTTLYAMPNVRTHWVVQHITGWWLVGANWTDRKPYRGHTSSNAIERHKVRCAATTRVMLATMQIP